MSRTYRTNEECSRAYAHGHYWTWDEERLLCDRLGVWTMGWKRVYMVNRQARDRKHWDKPPKWFKQQRRREERARVKVAMRSGREIPIFKKSDQWDWT
jgi:hypothetical protein